MTRQALVPMGARKLLTVIAPVIAGRRSKLNHMSHPGFTRPAKKFRPVVLTKRDDRSKYTFMSKMKKSDLTKERLLDSGKNLFASRGYHGVGLKEILTRAGTPKGSFYNFFASKEAFACEVAIEYAATMAADFDKAYADTTLAPLEFLRAAHYLAIEQYEFADADQPKGCLLARFSLEGDVNTPQMNANLRDLVGDWLQRLAGVIRDAQHAGDARDDLPADILARSFWYAWEGALMHAHVDPNVETVRKTLDIMLDNLIANKPARAS